jgi:hypothetical protein
MFLWWLFFVNREATLWSVSFMRSSRMIKCFSLGSRVSKSRNPCWKSSPSTVRLQKPERRIADHGLGASNVSPKDEIRFGSLHCSHCSTPRLFSHRLRIREYTVLLFVNTLIGWRGFSSVERPCYCFRISRKTELILDRLGYITKYRSFRICFIEENTIEPSVSMPITWSSSKTRETYRRSWPWRIKCIPKGRNTFWKPTLQMGIETDGSMVFSSMKQILNDVHDTDVSVMTLHRKQRSYSLIRFVHEIV